jgi:hypothetical protein
LILPLPSITAKAYKQQAVNIVTWNTADEGNLKGFEVERSANGQVFQKMATVLANGNSVGEAYTWTDAIPLNGNNYYRIKVLAQNGKVQYSQVMLVGPAAATATVAVYPQPALNGQFNLHLSGFSDGKYELRLINTFGQPVWTQMLQHKGSVAVYSVTVGQQYLATGLYQLQVLKNGKPVCIKPVLLQ